MTVRELAGGDSRTVAPIIFRQHIRKGLRRLLEAYLITNGTPYAAGRVKAVVVFEMQ